MMVQKSQTTSWGTGSSCKNPILYKVLAPSKRWLFRISEPSTVSLRIAQVFGTKNEPEAGCQKTIWLVVSNNLYFYPETFWDDPIWRIIFQMGDSTTN